MVELLTGCNLSTVSTELALVTAINGLQQMFIELEFCIKTRYMNNVSYVTVSGSSFEG